MSNAIFHITASSCQLPEQCDISLSTRCNKSLFFSVGAKEMTSFVTITDNTKAQAVVTLHVYDVTSWALVRCRNFCQPRVIKFWII